jgi:hypothetical protein
VTNFYKIKYIKKHSLEGVCRICICAIDIFVRSKVRIMGSGKLRIMATSPYYLHPRGVINKIPCLKKSQHKKKEKEEKKNKKKEQKTTKTHTHTHTHTLTLDS